MEKEEIDILNEFLPKGLSEDEVAAAITAAIAATGAAGKFSTATVLSCSDGQSRLTTGLLTNVLLVQYPACPPSKATLRSSASTLLAGRENDHNKPGVEGQFALVYLVTSEKAG